MKIEDVLRRVQVEQKDVADELLYYLDKLQTFANKVKDKTATLDESSEAISDSMEANRVAFQLSMSVELLKTLED